MYSQNEIDKILHDARYIGAETISNWTKKRFEEKLKKVIRDPEVLKEIMSCKLDVLKESLLKLYGRFPTSCYGNHTNFYTLKPEAVYLTVREVEVLKQKSKNPTSGRYLCNYILWKKCGSKFIPHKKRGVAQIKGVQAYFDDGTVKRTDSKGFEFISKEE